MVKNSLTEISRCFLAMLAALAGEAFRLEAGVRAGAAPLPPVARPAVGLDRLDPADGGGSEKRSSSWAFPAWALRALPVCFALVLLLALVLAAGFLRGAFRAGLLCGQGYSPFGWFGLSPTV